MLKPTDNGYELIFEDHFEGDSLNREYWNVELHEPGWVNEEWQEYIDSPQVIQVKDSLLSLIPVKKELPDGRTLYYSGRVSTRHKKDFVYGLFECRAKVPAGKGYLPAFWLMSTDENSYGQWPRCGEIDIMEVIGDAPDTLHGTIHYGNPHEQQQGTIRTEKGEADFAEDFHIFSCEWLPGSIRWFVDGKLFHEAHEWYSNTEGKGSLPYPAPFNNEFYIILNLAVGGSWVGYPDETTSFEKNPFVIDYVKVYRKNR